MPVRSSGYFNSPAFAQAASNLSQLFEPPSGADAAGWATANAKKAEAARIQQQFDYRNDPNFNQQTFDRGNIAIGGYSPLQSYYAQDQNDATKRRGDDITAATSRSNNAADNTRALETNRLSELGNLFVPLSEGQVRPDLPADVAGQFGVTHDLPAAQGRDKALSETEVQGGLIQKMRNAGLITDQQVADRYVGDKAPVEAVGPDGKPAYMSPGAAVRTGAAPYDAPKGNGTTMTLADGTTVQIGGDKPITEAQGKLVNYGTTAKTMNDVIDKLGGALTDPLMGASEASPTIGTLNPGNYAQTPEYQQARVAGGRFVQAILRNESGAATPDAEITHYSETLLPRPGDQPETVLLKAWGRQVAINALEGGMTVQARKAAVDAAMQSGPPPGWAPGAAAATGAPDAPAPAPTPAGGAVRHYNPATGKIE